MDPRKEANRVKEIEPVKQCPECFYTVKRNTTICPECSYQFGQEEKEIEHVDSELVEVGSFSFTTNYKKPEDCKNMKELYQLAKSRGYKPGWAYYQGKLRGFM